LRKCGKWSYKEQAQNQTAYYHNRLGFKRYLQS